MPEEVSSTNSILAIITLKKNKDYVEAGGAPLILVDDIKQLDETSMLIARLTLGMVHDVGNNIKLIIKH